MVGIGIGGVLNCFLDPIFIFDRFEVFGITVNGLGLEVAGASIATALSKTVSLIILLVPFVLRRSSLRFSFGRISFKRKIMRDVIVVGASSLLRNALSIVAGIVLNNIAGGISDSLLAAGIMMTCSPSLSLGWDWATLGATTASRASMYAAARRSKLFPEVSSTFSK